MVSAPVLRASVIDASFLARVSHGHPAQVWESRACGLRPAQSAHQLKEIYSKRKKKKGVLSKLERESV